MSGSTVPPGTEQMDDAQRLADDEAYRKLVAGARARERLAAESFEEGGEFYESLAADLAAPVPDEQWLWPGLVGARHRVVVAAMFKSGKTTLQVNLMRSYADEAPLFGIIPCLPLDGKLAFWNLEMDRADWLAYVRPMKVQSTGRVRTAHLRGKPVPFMSSKEARAQAVRELTGCSVWVIDTIGKVMDWHGIDANDNHGVGKLTDCIDQVMDEAGVSVLLASAHMPHAARGSREFERAIGAQKLSGWADSLINLLKDGHDRYLSATGRQVSLAESRLELGGDGLLTMAGGSRSDAAGVRIEYTLVTWLRGNPGANFRAIDQAVQGNQQAKREIIARLFKAGKIRIESGPYNSSLHWMDD